MIQPCTVIQKTHITEKKFEKKFYIYICYLDYPKILRIVCLDLYICKAPASTTHYLRIGGFVRQEVDFPHW